MRPLTLDNIKAELRIETADDDALLSRLITDCLAIVELDTGTAIRERTETLWMSRFADVMLPIVPFLQVEAIDYVRDSDGTTVTVSASDYWIDRSIGRFALVRFKRTPSGVREGTVRIAYKVGGGAVPEGLTRAVVALIGHYYNNPEAAAPVSLVEVPLSYRFVIEAYSVRSPLA
jgi:uncharacterized phiE125 gp8 family phage protein